MSVYLSIIIIILFKLTTEGEHIQKKNEKDMNNRS